MDMTGGCLVFVRACSFEWKIAEETKKVETKSETDPRFSQLLLCHVFF